MISAELLMLFLVSAIRAIVEVALLSLLGRGLLALLAGRSREQNSIYQLFCVLTRPVIRLVRAVVPRQIIDRHLPFVAFFVLFWLWLFLAYLKRTI
jgi:uncharacterized protein YggT (Ycf19 family)